MASPDAERRQGDSFARAAAIAAERGHLDAKTGSAEAGSGAGAWLLVLLFVLGSALGGGLFTALVRF